MCRTVRIYHQTFFKSVATGNTATYKFTRVMKTNPKQYFHVKVSVSKTNDADKGSMFLKNIPNINMNCNSVDFHSLGENNHLYLGRIEDGHNYVANLIMDEIPLDPFVLFSNEPNTGFVVSFQIELKSPDVL
jgi:hypothetical protein